MPNRQDFIQLFCVLVTSLLLACSQSDGDACQIDGDCDDGLECLRARGSERGTCIDPDDRGGVDAGTDAGSGEEPELPDEDAGSVPTDAGNISQDAGDVSPDDDAGS